MTISRVRSIVRPAVALLGAALVLAAAAAAAKGPKIVFKEESWSFGRTKQGVDLVHDFVFKNEGDADLHVKNVETACGCTAALLSDKKIEPGRSGRLKVTFATRGYAGEATKYIYVESDDPAQPRIQLKVSADIDVPPQPRIDLDRYTVDAGLLVEGEDMTAEVRVYNKGELELRFEASLPGAVFLIGGKPAVFPVKVAAGRETAVTINVTLANRMGPIREFALFRSNDPLRSTISVNLSGYIVTREQLKQLFLKYKAILK